MVLLDLPIKVRLKYIEQNLFAILQVSEDFTFPLFPNAGEITFRVETMNLPDGRIVESTKNWEESLAWLKERGSKPFWIRIDGAVIESISAWDKNERSINPKLNYVLDVEEIFLMD